MKTIIPPIPEIDYQMVMDALKGYAFPRKKLSDMLSHGDLIRVKKGIYIQSGPGIPAYSHEILANMIYGPSYVSFHYALAYHGLIPERVEEITSATTGKNKLIDTPVGRFSYKHLGFDYFSFGFSRKTVDNQRGFQIKGRCPNIYLPYAPKTSPQRTRYRGACHGAQPPRPNHVS